VLQLADIVMLRLCFSLMNKWSLGPISLNTQVCTLTVEMVLILILIQFKTFYTACNNILAKSRGADESVSVDRDWSNAHHVP